MEEISLAPRNGLTVASTFAGAGGSCTGYKMAGFEVLWANEFEPTAAKCYRANHPKAVLDTRSIREVKGQDILDAVGPVDVLDGSPPCQSFSMAGQRSSGWGKVIDHADGTTQRSDDLFFEYGRLLGELRPRAFVAENVKGLVTGVAKGMFKEIMAMLRDQGYVVRARVLDAQWLGVPQHRERVIIVGTRDDLGLEPVFPDPLPYRYSMADACPWLRTGSSLRWRSSIREHGPAGPVGWGQRSRGTDEPSPSITAGSGNAGSDSHPVLVYDTGGHFTVTERDPDLVPSPTVTTSNRSQLKLHDVKVGDSPLRPASRRTNKHAKNVDPEGASPTILATNAGWSDVAVETRSLSIEEVKRICSFPDDYVLEGTYDQQWVRLGNSVPPLMMRAVARGLADLLESGTSAASE
jgi:DNA (cytosine-5)-methyltransferase 1